MEAEVPAKINSFVILDLETTGLPRLQRKTRITELSILGVERKHLLQCYEKKNFMPRVVQKLNLCVYPNKLIESSSTEVSGLSNEMLESCKIFNEDMFELFQKMINILPSPICILAHNGNRFDFPILRSEIENIGKTLSNEIYCADTLSAFRELLHKNVEGDVNKTKKLMNEEEIGLEKMDISVDNTVSKNVTMDVQETVNDTEKKVAGMWESQSWDAHLYSAAEEAEVQYLGEVIRVNINNVRQNNETTPSKSRRGRPNLGKRVRTKDTKKKNGINNSSPTRFDPSRKRNETSNTSPIRNFSPTRCDTNSTTSNCDTSKKKNDSSNCSPARNNCPAKIKYRLQDCYLHLTGKEIVNAHRADSDTHALLECVVAVGPRVVKWIDENCQSFNNIKKMW